ncbi:hypothetical protein LEP1GSC052_4290 [Leptospira kmetyi serovar Malaysia str. Bejo-Iso9]|nr:hypothetical protein LEP1GSC052_4290 [Leptospira kmetyi serovar Malaysia str. Bejo-Iso9]
MNGGGPFLNFVTGIFCRNSFVFSEIHSCCRDRFGGVVGTLTKSRKIHLKPGGICMRSYIYVLIVEI